MTRDCHNQQNRANHHQKPASNQSNGQLHHKIVHFEPFKLFSQGDGSLKKAAEIVERASLGRFKVCVVSVISKDSLDESMKNNLVQCLLGNNQPNKRKQPKNQSKSQPAAKSTSKASTSATLEAISGADEVSSFTVFEDDFEVQVVGQVNPKTDVIVLNLSSFLETDNLHLLSQNIDQMSREGEFLENSTFASDGQWPRWNQNLIKTMLILLIMSHIVVFYNPEPSIDYNLIQLFKILEQLRLKSQTRIADLLETIASKQMFPQQWIRMGRVSCPRALFVCDTSYLGVDISMSDVASMKRDLEDQIYKLLKKTDIINPRSLNLNQSVYNQPTSLIHLSERGDFVIIITRKDLQSLSQREGRYSEVVESAPQKEDDDEFYSRLSKSLKLSHVEVERGGREINIRKQTQQETTTEHDEPDQDSSQVELDLAAGPTSSILSEKSTSNPKLGWPNRFKKFINRHITEIQAVNRPNDQVNNKYNNSADNKQPAIASGLLLPRYDDFFTVLMRLKGLFFPNNYSSTPSANNSEHVPNSDVESINWLAPDERRFIDIYDLVNNDELFSKRHCHQTKIAALKFYSRLLVLPADVTAHRNSLESAKQLYLNHARGPACKPNLESLIDQCNQYFAHCTDFGVDKGNDVGPSPRNCNRAQSSKNNSSFSTVPNQSTKNTSTGYRPNLSISRRDNGIKMMTSCTCGRQSNFMITPIDKKKKLERVDIHRLNE